MASPVEKIEKGKHDGNVVRLQFYRGSRVVLIPKQSLLEDLQSRKQVLTPREGALQSPPERQGHPQGQGGESRSEFLSKVAIELLCVVPDYLIVICSF